MEGLLAVNGVPMILDRKGRAHVSPNLWPCIYDHAMGESDWSNYLYTRFGAQILKDGNLWQGFLQSYEDL